MIKLLSANGAIPSRDCARHREALRRSLPDGLILVSGGEEIVRNNDVHYAFRQHSNFLYLAGVPEPGYRLLLDPRSGQDILFIPRIDTDHRVWLGHVAGPAETKRRFGVAEVRFQDELPGILAKLRKRYRLCYADPQAWSATRKEFGTLVNKTEKLAEALETLRAVKTPGEIELLGRANEVSAQGHLAVMRAARPGMREYELQAEFEAVCLRRGLKHQGYQPIVAAGRNGAVLHYHHNHDVLRARELLLIDAGAECGGYAADITRTFPIGGRFSQRQKDIYSIVLDAQKQCIERARPGVLSGDLHLHATRVLAEGLRHLGFLKGSIDELVLSGAVRIFFPHGIGHMLGLDVHDSLGGKRRQIPAPPHLRLRFNARLEPGFVITVEPGIYFNEALIRHKQLRRRHKGRVDFSRAEKFLDFGGVRIEDDIVIRPFGRPLNLTRVPKETAAVEAACRKAQ
ncbi:MAG: aminopeptidase P family protein [Elusimicrobia bacterium]|nr:aminopeptidase P family protein [Elusimicrobiota bacterium]